MELSWSYLDTMNRMVSYSAYRPVYTEQGDYCPISLLVNVDFEQGDCVVPIFCASSAVAWFAANDNKSLDVVIPLCVETPGRTCSGAETMLKYFSRFYNYSSRLGKVISPKGEVYYGASGIVLDKDFNPLLLCTTKIHNNGQLGYEYRGVTIHISPKVFTDDTSVINKSLAKKGMAYFLGPNIRVYNNTGPIKVEIDDCSKFFKRAAKPDLTAFSEEDIQKLLQDNIKDVLGQFDYDYRVNG